MNKSSKVKHILGYLSDQLFRAWSAFLVAKHIDQVLEDDNIKSLHYFFVATYLSCTESTILGLSKLTIPHNDSMHVEYFLNWCEQNPQAFVGMDKDDILKQF